MFKEDKNRRKNETAEDYNACFIEVEVNQGDLNLVADTSSQNSAPSLQ